MKIRCNIKVTKKCAFCKYWYDPTNAHIKPIAPGIGLWEYDTNAKCKCLKMTNTQRLAGLSCKQYECKF